MSRIEPQDRIDLTNIKEHDRMIIAINGNYDVSTDAKNTADSAKTIAIKALNDVTTAVTKANIADAKADDAQETADNASSKASANALRITDLETFKTFMASNGFISASFTASSSAMTVTFKTQDGNSRTYNVPLVTANSAGICDSTLKKQVDTNTNAIATLSSKITIIFVAFPSANPSQAEINIVYSDYRTAYPNTNLPAVPYQGMQMVDSLNNVTTIYDSIQSVWNFTTNAVSVATNNNYGIIIGEENGTAGSLYIVNGKALVNGFDDLNTRVTNAENEIAINTSDITTNKNNITANTLQIATNTTAIASNLVAINGKETKMIDSTVTVETTAWVTNTYGNATDYPYMAVVTISGMTADYVPMVVFGESDTFGGTYSGNAISGSGNVTIFTNAVPVASIIIRVIGKV